jgi:hypothetical protein
VLQTYLAVKLQRMAQTVTNTWFQEDGGDKLHGKVIRDFSWDDVLNFLI